MANILIYINFFSQATCASRNSDWRGSRCGRPRCIVKCELHCKAHNPSPSRSHAESETVSLRPVSHRRLSRRRLVAQRLAVGLAFPDDYEKSAAVTSDIVFLSSLKLNAHYSGRTGWDSAAVDPKRPEKEKEGKKNVGAPCSVWQAGYCRLLSKI